LTSSSARWPPSKRIEAAVGGRTTTPVSLIDVFKGNTWRAGT
jgi:hypothetical protein